jgi:hypothetical protein
MENKKKTSASLNDKNQSKTGLDEWNNRLDENLEPEDQNNIIADEKARLYAEKNSTEDQSPDNVK